VRASKLKAKEQSARVSGSGNIHMSVVSMAGMNSPDINPSHLLRDNIGPQLNFQTNSVISANRNEFAVPGNSSNFYRESQLIPMESEKRKLIFPSPRLSTLTALPMISESNGQLVYPTDNKSRHSAHPLSELRASNLNPLSLFHSQPPSVYRPNMEAIEELESHLFQRDELVVPVYRLRADQIEEYSEQP